ncbi:hypothetical protein ILUMI_21527 [Ignelater luminosus]|uniref:Uncharacterized protein n=1 Tax=Ignelater luminosus TaxID=2038154 RepID=A0A8K0FXW0_IGNLU|nr:hypothetical protein ILUMI_21527 [Ignelater luminosus]
MSASIFENKDAYLQNTYFQTHKREYGDFTAFYITVTICTLLFTFIIVLNIVLGCCSRYSHYWTDRHTGNRWIVSLWTATPHKQPSLDYTELRYVYIPPQPQPPTQPGQAEFEAPTPPPAYHLPPAQIQYSKSSELLELQPKRESAI